MALVSNGLKKSYISWKIILLHLILPLLVSEVSYVYCAVDELVRFSAMYYNAFQVTSINQLFKF